MGLILEDGLLFAVHISDGVLSPACQALGFAGAAILLLVGAWRLREDEIPQIAVLAAAFFVASLIRVPAGPASVHLLLSGLLGVILGRRAALAAAVGLFLQAVLLLHGGYGSLGVNICTITLPALLTAGLFKFLHRPAWLWRPGYRVALVGSAVIVWTLSAVFTIVLLATNHSAGEPVPDPGPALRATFAPSTLTVVGSLAGLLAWMEQRLGHAVEFPLGLLLGVVSVLTTTSLAAAVLILGGVENFRIAVLYFVVAHVPVAAVEGLVVGFTLGFLARVKPQMLDVRQPFQADSWSADSASGSKA